MTAPTETLSTRWIIIFLLLAIAISGVSVDIYVPSLPAITQFFATSKTLTQLSLGFFMISYGLFSLIIGPLSDAYGRKRPLIFGTLLYIASTLAITFSPNIHYFLFWRVIQGIAIAAITATARAITPDVFTGKPYKKVSNMITIAWSMGPILAPFVGGYLQHYFHWQACFYTLCGYGCVLLILLLTVIPETHRNPTPISFSLIQSRVKQLLTTPVFLGAAFLCGLVYACILIFNTMGPYLIQAILGFSAIDFGMCALTMGLAIFIGNITNKFFLDTRESSRLKWALSIMALTVALECLVVIIHPMSLWTIVVPTFFILMASGMVFSTSYGAAMRQFPEFSGLASAVLGALFVCIAGITSAITSALKTQHQTDFAIMFLITILLAIISYYGLFCRRSKIIKSQNPT